MNSLPAAPYFLLDQNHVFTGEKMTFPLALSTDKQVERSAITYQITISRDSTGNDVILDTIFSEPKGNGDSRVFYLIQNLEENQRYFTRIRAFDGAEYSSWSGALPFYVNTVNELPERFHLKSPISGEITHDYPILSWNYAKDPDENFGGGIQEYIVLIATDQEFTQVVERTHSPPDICSYQTENLDNHRTYYWSVIARDAGGLESKSHQIGFFIPNSGNRDPLPPILVSPKDSSIVKPTDYLSWYLQDDPDVYDRMSCEISILSIDGFEIFMEETLTDSIINMARQYQYPGIEASYDNRIKFRLNRLAKIESLKEGKLYQFQVKVWDNWGGSINSEWEDAIFRFDDGINIPPLPPDDILKPDSEILTASTPYLYWSPGYDSDISDRLRYQVILNQNKDFKSRTYIVLETPYNTTEIEVKNPLLENRQYFWKVRSIDMSDAKSEWSRTGSFWVNSINEPPFGPIELISPSSLSEVRPESGFWWFKGSDPDPGDRVSYILEIDKEPNFKSPVIKHQIERHSPDAIWSETSSKPPNAIGFPLNKIPDHTILKDNALYYWRVTAIDNKGLRRALTDNPPRFAYNLLNDPPSAVKAGFRP